jgi:hypothetical protein
VDSPDVSLWVKGNTWQQGTRDIYANCTFTAQQTSNNTWKVALS